MTHESKSYRVPSPSIWKYKSMHVELLIYFLEESQEAKCQYIYISRKWWLLIFRSIRRLIKVKLFAVNSKVRSEDWGAARTACILRSYLYYWIIEARWDYIQKCIKKVTKYTGDTQSEIIADVMHNYRRISRDIIHNYTWVYYNFRL